MLKEKLRKIIDEHRPRTRKPLRDNGDHVIDAFPEGSHPMAILSFAILSLSPKSEFSWKDQNP